MECLKTFPETADIETSSDDYASRFSGGVGSWFLEVQEEATLRLLTSHAGGKVLDVGGGHGQLAGSLIERGYEVTVLGSAEKCKQRIQVLVDEGRCKFDVGNILHLPYPDQSFQIVVSFRLLPHVGQWRQFLSELCRVAQGVVLVDYPEVRSINYMAPYFFKFKKQIEKNTRPYTSFRETELLETFNSLGFQGAERFPEFFMPMVLHRMVRLPSLSATVEKMFRWSGATSLLGSPVILKTVRR